VSARDRDGVGGPVDGSSSGAERAPSKRLAVDLREAGEMMGVCAETVKREIGRGRLRGMKIGRVWRVRVSEIEAYMERQERQVARE
jgi:excisionase family DNA binding protein